MSETRIAVCLILVPVFVLWFRAFGEDIVITKNGKPGVLMRIVDEKEIVRMASMGSK